MPSRYDDDLRQAPRKRSRSLLPRHHHRSYRSPGRRNPYDSDRKESKRAGRDYSRSPSPRRRQRSRSPKDDRRRSKGEPISDGSSPEPRRYRSRGPRNDRQRVKQEPTSGSISPKPRRRNSRDDRQRVKRERTSDGVSPSPRHTDSRDRRKPSHRNRSNSRSPSHKRRHNDSHDSNRKPDHRKDTARGSPPSPSLPVTKRSTAPLPSQQAAFSKDADPDAIVKPDEPEKQKPNYAPSGLLAAETNTVANTSIVLKYNEPPESRLPPASQPWRLYVFKAKDLLDTIPLHKRPCWLFGREKAVVDVPVEHPSASKQHAVLQFRYIEKVVGEFGERRGHVGLYIIDLESANGTKLNDEALPKRRFVECKSGDMIKFGESTREYVVLLPPKE